MKNIVAMYKLAMLERDRIAATLEPRETNVDLTFQMGKMSALRSVWELMTGRDDLHEIAQSR